MAFSRTYPNLVIGAGLLALPVSDIIMFRRHKVEPDPDSVTQTWLWPASLTNLMIYAFDQSPPDVGAKRTGTVIVALLVFGATYLAHDMLVTRPIRNMKNK